MDSNSTSPELLYGNGGQDYQPLEGIFSSSKRKSTTGRKLMRWDRELSSGSAESIPAADYFEASKDQQVLLCVEYVVSRDGIPLDWNAVAKVVEPGGFLTGEAIKQHLSKLRAHRERAGPGFPVPPKLTKSQVGKKKQQLVAVPLIKKPVVRQKPTVQQEALVKQEPDTEDIGTFRATPQNKANSTLLFQKPKVTPKPPSMKTGNSSTLAELPTKKRKLAINYDVDKNWKLSMDGGNRFKSVNANATMAPPSTPSKSKTSDSPKKKRRANLTNFPEGDPNPSNSSPFASPFASPLSKPHVDTSDVGGTGMSLRAQARINYTEDQIEDTTASSRSSSVIDSPVNYNQDSGMEFSQALLGNTLVEDDQFGMQAQMPVFPPSGPDYFGSALVDQSSDTQLYGQTLAEAMAHSNPMFGSRDIPSHADPGFYQSQDYFMPRAVAQEVDEMETAGQKYGDQDFGGTYGSMPGVGMGGDTGVFQMDRFNTHEDAVKEEYFNDVFDLGFGEGFQLYSGEASQGDSALF